MPKTTTVSVALLKEKDEKFRKKYLNKELPNSIKNSLGEFRLEGDFYVLVKPATVKKAKKKVVPKRPKSTDATSGIKQVAEEKFPKTVEMITISSDEEGEGGPKPRDDVNATVELPLSMHSVLKVKNDEFIDDITIDSVLHKDIIQPNADVLLVSAVAWKQDKIETWSSEGKCRYRLSTYPRRSTTWKTAVIPVRIGLHWSLAMLYKTTKKCKYYCTLRIALEKADREKLEKICRLLLGGQEVQIDIADGKSYLLQKDGINCGAFICLLAVFILSGGALFFDVDDANQWRKKVYEFYIQLVPEAQKNEANKNYQDQKAKNDKETSKHSKKAADAESDELITSSLDAKNETSANLTSHPCTNSQEVLPITSSTNIKMDFIKKISLAASVVKSVPVKRKHEFNNENDGPDGKKRCTDIKNADIPASMPKLVNVAESKLENEEVGESKVKKGEADKIIEFVSDKVNEYASDEVRFRTEKENVERPFREQIDQLQKQMSQASKFATESLAEAILNKAKWTEVKNLQCTETATDVVHKTDELNDDTKTVIKKVLQGKNESKEKKKTVHPESCKGLEKKAMLRIAKDLYATWWKEEEDKRKRNPPKKEIETKPSSKYFITLIYEAEPCLFNSLQLKASNEESRRAFINRYDDYRQRVKFFKECQNNGICNENGEPK